jgi:4-diphosphocytidyl-2-C-methyl-D-erythritol kinase
LTPLHSVPALLALPPVEVPTPEAYGLLSQEREAVPQPREPRLFSPDGFSDWDKVTSLAENDFEGVVLGRYPLLDRIRGALQESGPMFTLLCGSGAALFALYYDETAALEASLTMGAQFPDTRFVLSRTEDRLLDLRLRKGG